MTLLARAWTNPDLDTLTGQNLADRVHLTNRAVNRFRERAPREDLCVSRARVELTQMICEHGAASSCPPDWMQPREAVGYVSLPGDLCLVLISAQQSSSDHRPPTRPLIAVTCRKNGCDDRDDPAGLDAAAT